MISHPALQRGSSPTLKPVPASLSLEFQEAHSAALGPNFWDVKKLLLNRAVAVQKTPWFQKDGSEGATGIHCSSSFPELTTSGNATGVPGTAVLCVSPSSQGGGAVPLPWSKVLGGQGGGERERRCLTHHLFSEQCSGGFLINHTPRCRK